MIDPSTYSGNEAWVLFRLNEAPIRTEADGDFNAMAIMEVSTGMIFGMEMVPVESAEIVQIHARRLLESAASNAGGRPSILLIASEDQASQISAAAETMDIEVKRVPGKYFSELTKEAREGFTRHVSGRGVH